ncbi:hypothetical protein CCACVL1_16062 [Corchorus capsularis]|uniref:Uncharacterized protein n=1 Tax=Corchorus capsularis TaxID=210143 RepID=A0A1R3HZF7_COCAP|nr:hypothetical protein CCACVL1_16062 [Corchorus capsularis]
MGLAAAQGSKGIAKQEGSVAPLRERIVWANAIFFGANKDSAARVKWRLSARTLKN